MNTEARTGGPAAQEAEPAAAHPARAFPLPPPGGMGPPAEYAELQQGCPVARVRAIHDVPGLDTTGWFVTRYDDVRDLLADPRLIRPDVNDWPVTPDDWPRIEPDMVTLMELEGEEHAALRRAVADAFSVRAVRGHAERIRGIADELLDALEEGGGPADLVAGFTEPFPIRVMCEITGIPYAGHETFTRLSKHLLFSVDLDDDDDDITQVMRDLVLEWIALRRREPGDDVLTDLIGRCDAGELTEEDVVRFGRSMIIAGFLPSTMFLGNAALALLTRPDTASALRADPGLMPGAVEELLRHLPVLNGNVLQLATEDIEVGGQAIRAGELVIPVIAAANRDPSVFPDPGRLDLSRIDNPHLAFGRGTHNCLGAHLTRTKFAIGLGRLLERFPELRLAVGEDEIPWPSGRKFSSPLALPVRW
ncbi:cytochrome P450 [Nocardiopsis sediminis]|uniref:Cytochrome P450 n=1 Tax=Nocardiopsis sediminis TaxID=1778267 RepID=A0ABV8FF69_9ACTN